MSDLTDITALFPRQMTPHKETMQKLTDLANRRDVDLKQLCLVLAQIMGPM
jgi:hypothetical protein